MKDWESKFQESLHSIKIELPEKDNPSLHPPLYDSVKFSFENSDEVSSLFNGDREGYLYSRYKNPNSEHLARTLSSIMGRQQTILTPNGISAISLILEALTYPGACVMYFMESYAPTKVFIRNFLSKWGVEAICCNIDDHDSIKKLFAENSPDVLIFESPTNPQLKIADIEFLLNLCQKYNCKSVLDNTFASLHQHNQYPIDVILHSLSKFASGHGDLMGGSLSFNNTSLYEEVQNLAHARGVCLEPAIARDFYRSLQTYSLRYRAYTKNALHLAKALEEKACFNQLIFPGLKSHPEYDLAVKQQSSPGNVIYAELKTNTDVFKFIDRLQHFTMSPSLGSNESLVAPVQVFYGHGMSPEERASANIDQNKIRFSIGLEDPDILLGDILSALR